MIYLFVTYFCLDAFMDTKRQNFNITPEQEAEIAQLKELINSPTIKDAILSSVRICSVIARKVREGNQLFLVKEDKGQMYQVLIPELEVLVPPKYKYLVERPHSWKRQLYVKGRRLPAASVYKDYLLEKRTVKQLAEDWELPVEAVQECVSYCAENQALLVMEAMEEQRLAGDMSVDADAAPAS